MANLDVTGAGGLTGMAQAIGGSAGNPFSGVGPPVSGADATAIARGTLTADTGNGLHISAVAQGGAGYPFLDPNHPDIAGAALARASGTENFSGGATPPSDVSASASSGGGFISFNASASSPVNGSTSIAEARAAADQPVFPPSLGNGLQAGSFITGLPSKSDVQALEARHKNVQNAFSNNGTIALAVADFATKSYATKSITTSFFGASATFYLDPFVFQNTPFQVGLLDGIATEGTGFQELTFSIELAHVIVETDHFSTLASAVEFFHDHVIDIAGLDPEGKTIALNFYLTLESTGGGDGFSGQFIVGAVPEPSTDLLLGLALVLVVLQQIAQRRNISGPKRPL
jgi:hypothetical protein